MKINSKITIEVKWDEEEKVNKTSLNFDPNLTFSEVLTSIEMGNKALRDVLFSYVKNENELEETMNKSVKFFE